MTPPLDGRYAVEAELGRGSMGRVLAVKDLAAGSVPRAVKLLERPELRADLVAEFTLLRELAHPTFVSAHRLGVEREGRRLYAVLGLVRGVTLAEARPDDIGDPVAAVAELLRALDHLHRLGFVHGDLAPANVMLLAPPATGLKILDLGAGGRAGSRRGSTSGVLAYAAPERLAGEALTPAGDLWSLGAVAFTLIHGRHPFPGYPAPSQAAGGPERQGLAAHALDPVLARLLAWAPADRFPNAAAALTELEHATGRPLPLAPVAETVARLREPVFFDAGGVIERLEQRLSAAADAQQPSVGWLGGPVGAGRTRALAELSQRLAARGMPVLLERAAATDAPFAPWLRALEALDGKLGGAPTPASVAQALGRAARRQKGAVAVLVDDLDVADDATRAVLPALSRASKALPERYGPLIVVAVGAGDEETRLGPWAPEDVERWLERIFPGRRIGPRVAEPLRLAGRGQIGLMVETLSRLVTEGALEVDATAITLRDAEPVLRAAPTSRVVSAERAVGGLDAAQRRAAALLGWARGPVPAGVIGADGAALVRAGLATWTIDGRLEPASEAVRAAERASLEPGEAHAALAASWAAKGGEEARAEALWHELHGPEAPKSEAAAERALDELPAAAAAPLVAALTARGWPRTAAAAAAGGRVLEATNRVEAALALYERSAEEATSALEAARALAAVGRLQARQSRHAQASAALRSALERGGDELPAPDRAAILATLARSGVMTGAIDEAAAWSEEGLTLAGEDAGLVGRLRYSRGLVAWYRGDLGAAAADFEVALAATRESGDLAEQAAVVTGLGLVAHRRGDFGASLAAYREALQLGEQAGDDARVLSALQNLGVVFHERGEWIAALDAYKEALGLAEALDQPGRVVQLAGNLGNLWRYLGELDAARDVLQRGLERARTDGNRYMEAVILNLLADVASDGEAWATAERLWLDAIAVTTEASCSAEEAEARLNLARLYLERKSHDEARRVLAEGRRACERLEGKQLRCLAHALAAGLERQALGGDLERARAELDRALELLEGVTDPEARWPVLLEAMWLARDEGDLQAAMDRALEVRGILQKQLDTVPARHRVAFRARRDRRDAWRETVVFADLQKLRGGGPERDTAWIRLLEVNKRLATEHSVTRLLEYIMDSAILLTGAERGFLLLNDDADDGGPLEVRVARNLDQENIKNKQLKISHGIARRVIEEGGAVITVDAMEDERYRDQLSVHDLRLRSILCLPMRLRGTVLGAIYLDNRFRASAFSDSDLPVMEGFSDLAAIALDNARLLEARDKSQAALEKARAEVEALNSRLAGELEARTQELEDTHRVVIRQRRELVGRHKYDNIIGDSAPIRRVYAMMDRLLDNDVPVLVEGESGTGKELVARAIHFNGSRQDRPFVAVNCGAIPSALLESEFFGHVRGAFTNAMTDKKGLFEAAHTGSLLLDEIGELPLEMQVKLLRVLQNGEVKKVGANRELKVDVRIIAATNRKLDQEVRAGRFREDLYYRLSVVPIHVPALRERREDIPLLVAHFIEVNRKNQLGPVTGIAKEAMALLSRYSWPGNVRQLEMVLKNASVFAEGPTLHPHDFESFPDILGGDPQTSASSSLRGKSLADIEREAIIVALRETSGNKKKAAEQLGIDRRTLYNKLSAYGIVVEKELRVT